MLWDSYIYEDASTWSNKWLFKTRSGRICNYNTNIKTKVSRSLAGNSSVTTDDVFSDYKIKRMNEVFFFFDSLKTNPLLSCRNALTARFEGFTENSSLNVSNYLPIDTGSCPWIFKTVCLLRESYYTLPHTVQIIKDFACSSKWYKHGLELSSVLQKVWRETECVETMYKLYNRSNSGRVRGGWITSDLLRSVLV